MIKTLVEVVYSDNNSYFEEKVNEAIESIQELHGFVRIRDIKFTEILEDGVSSMSAFIIYEWEDKE